MDLQPGGDGVSTAWTAFQNGFRPGRRFRVNAGLQRTDFLKGVGLEYGVHPESAGYGCESGA